MISDPEAVKKLRNDLLDTVDGLKQQLKKTESAMETVAKEWKDSQFQTFNEGFTKDMEIISPLCDDIEAFEDEVLRPLEEIQREYLDL